MNTHRFTLISSALLAALAAACGDGAATDSLLGPAPAPVMATDPGSLSAGPNTAQHFKESIGGDNGITDEKQQQADDQATGSPEVVARLHGTQKIAYDALGTMLADLGVDFTKQNGAGDLYKNGGSALGMPVYANRVPEQIVPSTASLAKQFDIYSAGAGDIAANIAMTSKRCPGVVLVQNNAFTEDGVSCLIGKPAHPEHVMLANQLVGEATTPQLGIEVAIATLLSAAHTSE